MLDLKSAISHLAFCLLPSPAYLACRSFCLRNLIQGVLLLWRRWLKIPSTSLCGTGVKILPYMHKWLHNHAQKMGKIFTYTATWVPHKDGAGIPIPKCLRKNKPPYNKGAYKVSPTICVVGSSRRKSPKSEITPAWVLLEEVGDQFIFLDLKFIIFNHTNFHHATETSRSPCF